MKRLLNCTTSEMLSMNKDELKQSILASEGRTIMTETVVACPPLLGDLTNAELAVSFGSDMVLLNVFDCDHPQINGLPETDEPVKLLKKLVGRPVGCNLEPIDENAKMMENRLEISHGRHATKETFIKAKELGFDFICLTGNPGTGVSNASIENAIKLAKEYFGGMIIAGKMHSSGIDEALVDLPSIERFIDAGADIILMPAVYTVPGLSEEEVRDACKLIKSKGALSLSSIGTSQEGSDEGTIREIALVNKRCGIDIQHIGDAGWCGIALPENIMALSIAIRGKRWTYHKIASSVNR
ncbi:haloacid dehalogenase-like hydrolase [Allocoprobacillus halotolerans]|uniref:Haloacid dehalogenase-like hydrolase n=1 Tax=Allocoprobacillus halotolerans TaxID=2944914 RepID=A0ABY5HYH6_9FIRM|nr:haloacid dehalogenase-like hydrolase [Allocoprobacillus halotolerans]UTY37865.1 haloacid dehalogenase-like hydrolase [Allocoprobacillus halotolerans]